MTLFGLSIHAWLIPIIAGLVGWGTNWLAVVMTFRPLEYVGFRPFPGWQGVIPRKSERMAHICIDRTLERFGDLHAIYERLDPELITGQVLSRVMPRLDEYIDEIMYELHPVLWDNVPMMVRRRIYHWAEKQLPERVEHLISDFGHELGELVDLKALISRELEERPEFMNEVFMEAGREQFRFLIRSGAVIGAIMGGVLMLAWLWGPQPVVLVSGAFIVGAFTNWLALNLIFRPVKSRSFLGWPVQGLFLRRQPEISEAWARKIGTELLTVEKVAHAMLHGEQGGRTRAIVQKNLRPLLDQSVVMRLVTQTAVGTTGYVELKQAMSEKALEASDEAFHNEQFNRDRGAIVSEMIRQRIADLPPAEFQDILRPAFQEDEWRLMAAGGLMGGLAGVFQVGLMSLF